MVGETFKGDEKSFQSTWKNRVCLPEIMSNGLWPRRVSDRRNTRNSEEALKCKGNYIVVRSIMNTWEHILCSSQGSEL